MSAHPASTDDSLDKTLAPVCVAPQAWPFPLRTARVALRALRMDDVERFLAYRSDPEISKYQGWEPMTELNAREFIDEMKDVHGPKAGAWVQLGIALSENDCLIGDIGLWLREDGKAAQIGYTCASPFQRQGMTTEAVSLLLDCIARYTECGQVHAIVDSRNIASQRLLLRLSFHVENSATAVSCDSGTVELTYQRHLRR